MTNTCKLRPTMFVEKLCPPFYQVGWNAGLMLTSFYINKRVFYFYGLEIGLGKYALFIGFKKVCR